METLFFLLIIGILSAVFGGGKGKKRSQPFRSRFERTIQTVGPKRPNLVYEEKVESVPVETITVGDKMETEEPWARPSRSRKERNQQGPKQEENDSIAAVDVEDDSLINGIIWSEILGEPRSKRKYYARKG